MSTLNTASQVISTLIKSTQMPQSHVESCSLWVFSVKELLASERKQGSGVTFKAKGGYITTRQNKEGTSITLPFYQSTKIDCFIPQVNGDKLSAKYSTLSWEQDGHEYPYNTKLNFSVKMCQELCLAALGEQGLMRLFASQLEDTTGVSALQLLKEITSPAIWWSKILKVLPGCDLQIQCLVMIDAELLQKGVVKQIYNTTEKAFDFDVSEHIVGFQIVSQSSKEYIYGLGLPMSTIQLLKPREEQTLKVYKSVDEIPLTTKVAETQLRRVFVIFLNENEQHQANPLAAIPEFLKSGIKSTKLNAWLETEGNSEKAAKWLSKVKFNKSATKASDFLSKSEAKSKVETNKGGDALDIIMPEVTPKVNTLASTFTSDEGDDDWAHEAE